MAELIDACTSDQRAIQCHVQQNVPSEETRKRRRYGADEIDLVEQN